MKRTGQNDFTQEETRQKSKYKLWVKYYNLLKPRVYYSFEHPKNPAYGYNRLIGLVNKNRLIIKQAILFDNQTGKELERYNFS